MKHILIIIALCSSISLFAQNNQTGVWQMSINEADKTTLIDFHANDGKLGIKLSNAKDFRLLYDQVTNDFWVIKETAEEKIALRYKLNEYVEYMQTIDASIGMPDYSKSIQIDTKKDLKQLNGRDCTKTQVSGDLVKGTVFVDSKFPVALDEVFPAIRRKNAALISYESGIAVEGKLTLKSSGIVHEWNISEPEIEIDEQLLEIDKKQFKVFDMHKNMNSFASNPAFSEMMRQLNAY